MTAYYKEIFSYVKKMITDKSSANDITQETFTRVLKFNKKNKIENERAFLYRVAKNIMIDNGRKKTNNNIKEVSYEEEHHVNTYESENAFEKHKRNMLLKQAVQKLPKKRRQVFILYMIDGFTRKEIALKFNITVNAVDLNISRASTQLKEIIKELENE